MPPSRMSPAVAFKPSPTNLPVALVLSANVTLGLGADAAGSDVAGVEDENATGNDAGMTGTDVS